MKRILVISWYFPPINSSEGLVTYKLLNNSKYEYDVFMQNNNELWSYGKDEALNINKNINKIISKAKEINDFYNDAINYFKINQDKYDIVMTRSMPEVSHKIGLEIKKIKKDIIWLASFGDPIANNPFSIKNLQIENPYKARLSNFLSLKRFLKSLIHQRRCRISYKLLIKNNNKLQEKILNKCDYFICNNTYEKDYMLKDYSNKENLNKKAIIIPHSFDESMYTKGKKETSKKIIFNYIGHLDDIRTPHLLLEAIKKLADNDPNLKNKMELNFYGNVSDKEKLYIIDNDLLEIVKFKKNVSYLKSLEIMKQTDWLVHIDANLADIISENIFFAAKLVDYMGSKSKILAITMLNGISADILKNYNALCVEHSCEEIYNYLFLILDENYSKEPNTEYASKYSAPNVAADFDKKISKIIKERMVNYDKS